MTELSSLAQEPALGAMLGEDSIRRLILSFLLQAQKSRDNNGLIQKDQALGALIMAQSNAQIESIEITEDTLGFDSLGMLELITDLNRFFGLSASGVEDYLLVRRRIGDWVDLISQHGDFVKQDWQFGFHTSGSTGAPKLIHHSADVLWGEMNAQAAGPFADIRPPGRILSLVPPHHIYGFLFSCVLPEVTRAEVVDLHTLAPGAAFRHARAGDLIVGTPFNWKLLGKTGLRFCDDVYGVTSAGPSDAETWDVMVTNNLSHLTEVYGSSETAGIAVRTAHDASFTLLAHLKAENGHIARHHDGAVLDIQDTLEWETPTCFRLNGRRDNIVQVGGVNVCLKRVTDQIKQVNGVTDAAVRLGSGRLRAFVVPAKDIDQSALEARLQTHMVDTLDAPARPTSFVFGSELLRNEMGKPVDWD